MKKYFFVSDIHSFYTPFIEALNDSGFDINNQDHILCILGDVFDRGLETLELYNFLKSIPDDRLILIIGNHELLYKELLNASFPDECDFRNGTVRTFCSIAHIDEVYLSKKYWYIKKYVENVTIDVSTQIMDYWQKIVSRVRCSEITQWLLSKKWINYFETSKYIFVHSWIPTQYIIKGFNHIEEIGYREDWRNATKIEWEDATWGCPYKKAKLGWNTTGKTIVCGHWHTSDFFNNLTKQKKKEEDCPIFKSKKYKLIGLDACTIISNKVNVLVLNEDEL